MMSFIKKNLFGLVTFCLSAVILTVTIMKSGGGSAFLSELGGASPFWLLAAFCCAVAYWYFDALVLDSLVKKKYGNYLLPRSMKTVVTGLLYNALTPFGVGGQPAQIYDMTTVGVESGDSVSFITVKSTIYQVSLAVFAVAALIMTGSFFAGHVDNLHIYLLWGAASNFVILFLAILLFFNVKLVKRIFFHLIHFLRKIKLIHNWRRALKTCLKQVKIFYGSISALKEMRLTLAVCFLYTFMQLIVYYLAPFCVFQSLHMQVKPDFSNLNVLFYFMCAAAITSMMTSFVPIPGAVGAAEACFILMYGLFFSGGLIFTAVIIWRLATYYFFIIAGTAINFSNIKKKRRSVCQDRSSR